MKNFYIRFLLLTAALPILVASKLNYTKPVFLPSNEVLKDLPAKIGYSKVDLENKTDFSEVAGPQAITTSYLETPLAKGKKTKAAPKGSVLEIKPLPYKPITIAGKILPVINFTSAQNNDYTRIIETKADEFNNDPIRFSLITEKQQVTIGEEIEIKVVAELMDISPNLLFTFEELKAYTLKVIMPANFIQTGGTYHDYVEGNLDANNKSVEYYIKGKFESLCENCSFQLIRTGRDRNANSVFIKKAELTINAIDFYTLKETPKKDSLEKFDERARVLAGGDLQVDGNFNVTISGTLHKVSINVATIHDTITRTFFKEVRAMIDIPGGCNFTDSRNVYSTNSIDLTASASCQPINFVLEKTTFDSIFIKNTSNNTYSFRNAHFDLEFKYRNEAVKQKTCINQPTGGEQAFRLSANDPCIGETLNLGLSGIPQGTNVNWTGPGNYSATGTNPTRSNIQSNQYGDYIATFTIGLCTYSEKITVQKCAGQPDPTISIKSNNGETVCSELEIELVATYENCSANQIKWYKIGGNMGRDSTGQLVKISQPGTYYATCLTATSNQVFISADAPSAPSIAGRPGKISSPNNASLFATGCNGKNQSLKWYEVVGGNYIDINKSDNPLQVSKVGVYVASCYHPNCGESGKSNQVNVTEGLSIEPDYWEVRSNQTFNITAIGCTANNTKLQWKKNGTYLSAFENKNPITQTGSGNYSARCVPSHVGAGTQETEYPFETITVNNKDFDKPTITASAYEALDIDNITLTATGCPNGYQWNIKENYTNFTATATVTGPYTYYARCVYPNNTWGDWESVIIKSKLIGSIQLTSDKVKAYDIEAVNLSAVGCTDSRGGIQWKFGETYANGRNQTRVGPGTYYARCVVGNQWGEWESITIHPNTVEAISITSPKYDIYDNEFITLTAQGCTNALGGIQWEIYGELRGGRTTNVIGAGTYRGRCVVGNQLGPWAEVTLNMLPPPNVTITTNKDIPGNPVIKVGPFEEFIATATGCSMGYVQWETKAGLVSGSPISFTGPGRYRARCFISYRSIGEWSEINVAASPPDAINIITSKACAFVNEALVLTTNGCSDGQVNWILPGNITEVGRTLTAIGPGTYKVFCSRFGVSGPETSINISTCQSDAPNIATDRQLARPTDVVNVTLSGCIPATYYAKIIYPNSSYIIKFDKSFSVNGPFKIEAACSLVGGSTGPIRNAEVMLAPGNGLRVVSNKNQAAVSEAVVLTAYGCDFGQLQWKWGTSGTAGNVNPLTVSGPGYYYTRCVNDPAVAPEWTLTNIAAAAAYTPTVSGPTRVCPNSPVTLTASGCPVESNGTPWSYQWKTAENGWNNFNASITVYLPQTVSVRCAKPDGSFFSDTKEISVESPFSESFKASNTGPVSVGANVMLTATPIENATYIWYYPDGTTQVVAIANKITLGAGGRTISITGADPEMAGVYTVKAKITGSGTNGYCETSATTDLGISLCDDFVIHAKNPQSGEYTTRMPRRPNSRDQFDKLILTLENQDGVKPLYLTPVWSGPNGTPTRGEDAFTVEAPIMGTYKVNLGAGCEVELAISSQPCTLLDDSFKACSQAGAAVTIDNNKLTALAVDDYFNAGDYEVKVTEVSGDANNGWTGKGYTTFSIMSGVETDVAVEFTGIQIDQCYQLKTGAVNKVSVQYDPTWSNFIQPSKFMSLIGDFLDDLDAWVQTYKTDPNSQESKDIAAELYEMALAQKLAIDEDVVLTRTEIDEVLNDFNPVVNGLLMAKNGGSSPNGRLANDCPSWTDFDCYLNKARASLTNYFGKYWRVLQISYTPFCETNLDGSQKCGIVPKILWQSDPTGSLAFNAGLLDGAYFTVKEVGGTVYSLATLVGCMNPAIGAANFVTNADCRKKLTDGWDVIVGIGSLVKEPSKVWGIVTTETAKFIDNNVGFQPINKYYNGRFAFDVALMFIGVGEVSAILKGMNAVKAAELLHRASQIAAKFNVFGRMMSKAGVAISKTGSKAAKFVIRKANGQIDKVLFEYINGVYKGLKKRTATFNRYLGTIEGDVEFSDGTKGRGTYKIWGKCGAGAGLRSISDDCPIDDVAGEAIEGVVKHKVPKDVVLFGNSTTPRAPRLDKDVFADANGIIKSQKGKKFPDGASSFDLPQNAPLTGHYYHLTKDTELPEGLAIVADGEDVIPNSKRGAGHFTIYPTRDMTYDEFVEKFKFITTKPGGRK